MKFDWDPLCFRLALAAGFLAAASPRLIYEGAPVIVGIIGSIALLLVVFMPYMLFVHGFDDNLPLRKSLMLDLQLVAFMAATSQIIALGCFLFQSL